MAEPASQFIGGDYSPSAYWRSIVLLGRNVASYKFALGAVLLDLTERSGDFVSLEDLALPYAKMICNRLGDGGKQTTSPRSEFLDACRRYSQNELTQEGLVGKTIKHGFNHVLGAFHVVGGEPCPRRFFEVERVGRVKGIRLTENLGELGGSLQFQNLWPELDTRWRLVGMSWALSVPTQALTVAHDHAGGILVGIDPSGRRPPLAQTRSAISGYLAGRCFYCRREIELEDVHVDHYVPRRLIDLDVLRARNLDGVWNLVLACPECNAAKSDRLAAPRFYRRLQRRNEWYIASDHPLKPTVIAQTGTTPRKRVRFFSELWKDLPLLPRWEPSDEERLDL